MCKFDADSFIFSKRVDCVFGSPLIDEFELNCFPFYGYAWLFHVVQAVHVILCLFLVVYVALDRVDVFLFSLLQGRSEVVYVFQVASNCSTLFMFVFGRSEGFQMFWRVLERLRSLGCILVAHAV